MYRLLFVDDEAFIREGVSEKVPWKDLGYELAGTCENGRDAAAFLKEHPVDVVMTDVCMPFVDGMELSAIIRREYPHIKVLILSGYDDFEYAKSAIKYGVEEYILKPITSVELSEVLTGLKAKLDKEREEERRREDIYTAYRKNKLLIYSDALLHVLTGTKTEEECIRELEGLGADIKGPYFAVGIVGIGIYMDYHVLDEQQKKESALMAFIVFNLSQEIIRKHGGGEACQGRDHRTFLLFQGEEKEGFEERSRIVCSEILEKVQEVMGFQLNIGIGGVQRGLGNVYRSCEEAERALRARYLKGPNCIIRAQELEGRADTFAQLERIEGNVVRHVRENDRDKQAGDIRELAQALRTSGYGQKEVTDYLLGVADKTEHLIHTLGDRDWRDERESRQRILTAGCMEEAVDILAGYVQGASEYLEGKIGNAGRSLAHRGMEYIESHYGDSGLNLQAVCGHLGVSSSRFSSVFKETFGATFMDVLIGLRMKKARELLEMTELRTYEIAERVGFGDPHYFSIAFKKATGMTPTEYARGRKD